MTPHRTEPYRDSDHSQGRTGPFRLALAPVLLTALLVLRFAALRGAFDSWFPDFLRSRSSDPIVETSRVLYSSVDVQFWDVAVLILSLVLWLGKRRSEAVLLMLGLIVDIAAETMKIMETPLHFSGHLFEDLVAAASAGTFPSGHTVRVSVTLGLILVLFALPRKLWRIPAAAVISVALITVGLTSIITGGHTPSDVLGAYILAALWIDVLLIVRTVVENRDAPGGPGRNTS